MWFCKAPRGKLFRGTLSVTGPWKEKSSGLEEMHVMSMENHTPECELQEEYHSKVRDPLQQQKPGAGIKNYAIWEQEVHIDEQSEVFERSEQRVACTCIEIFWRWDLAAKRRNLCLNEPELGASADHWLLKQRCASMMAGKQSTWLQRSKQTVQRTAKPLRAQISELQ